VTPPAHAPWSQGLLEAVWVVDALSLRIVAANQAAADLTGLPVADLLGLPAVQLSATPQDQFFWEDVAAGLESAGHTETLVRSADGEPVPVEQRVTRTTLADGQLAYLVALRDLRPQQKAEKELERLVAELRATLESTADGILVTDMDGAVRSYNRRFAELWEVPEDLLINPQDRALYAHLVSCVADPDQYAQQLQHMEAEPLQPFNDVVTLRSGRLLERVAMPQFSRGEPTGRVFSYRDITQRVDFETRLRLAAKVFESSLDAVFITGPDFGILAVNPQCEQLTGCIQAQLVGSSARELFHDPHDLSYFLRVEDALRRSGSWEGQLWHSNPGKPECAVQVGWVALRDGLGQVQHTIAFCKDLTEKLAAQRRIEQLAYNDVLTGLPNRLMLQQRVEHLLRTASRDGSSFAIMFLDLDRFKNINDSMGHAFGDCVLLEVAQRIKLCLRDVDTLCRIGGDEFVICLQHSDAIGAEVVAKRMLHMLANPFIINDMRFSVGCSIGLSLYPQDGRTLDELIKCADIAMYRVKERGRGNYRFYQPQMNVDLLSRIKMDHAMRQAMDNKQFRLHYQPQISLGSGRLLGAEALIRWHDPELGNVSPAIFIVLAEESGFIVSIGNWVLKEAVAQAATWQRAGREVSVAVNVSALQFQQADFVQRVADAVQASGLKPGLLELELTESILVKDANEALSRLHALAALGVTLSIDDFGTGYSSLSYLKKFPISKLKIDRSFVMGLPNDESDRAIVSATIGMARALKLKVVAEGVETPAQRDYLAGLSCDSFQGYLCAPGLSATDFEALWDSLRAGVTA
jgi:diguanylate cyclase (GGDEF)-like protein/PAS domain S-box-containing protein